MKLRRLVFTFFLTISVTFGEEAIELVQLAEISQEGLREQPKNLSRWHMAARLIIADEDGKNQTEINLEDAYDHKESVLLGDDETLACELARGIHYLIIDLGEIDVLSRFSFRNYGAQGKIELFANGSADSDELRKRHKVVPWSPFGTEKFVNFEFSHIDARYVHIKFDIEKAGEIGSLSVFGSTTVADTTFDREHVQSTKELARNPEDAVSFDYASLYTGSAITHVNAGNYVDAKQMIDDDVPTYYEFPALSGQSIMIVDIDAQTRVNRVSMLIDSGAGVLEFYYLPELPEELTGEETEPDSEATEASNSSSRRRGKLRENGQILKVASLSPEYFAGQNPDFLKNVASGEDRIRLSFDELEGRFLLIRWLPSSEEPRSLLIYEISLLGDVFRDASLLARVPPSFQFAQVAQEALSEARIAPVPQSAPRTPPSSP